MSTPYERLTEKLNNARGVIPIVPEDVVVRSGIEVQARIHAHTDLLHSRTPEEFRAARSMRIEALNGEKDFDFKEFYRRQYDASSE